MHAHLQSTSIPRSAPQSAFTTGYIAAPDFVQHPTFQSTYVRPSHEIYNSMSAWESLDMPVDHSNMNLAQIRRFEEKSTTWSHPMSPPISPMDSQQFSNMMIASGSSSPQAIYTPPPDQAIPLNGYTFPHRLSPLPSPTPSPFQEDVKPTIPTLPSPVQQSRRKVSDGSETGKTCSHCHATSTPLWRRDPSTMKPLCNACGLYLQQRNKLRPQELIDADGDGSSSDESDANYLGPECSHCHTHRTSVWRRSKAGDQLCNACGVYARLRGKPRPLSLKRKKIRPRSAKKTCMHTDINLLAN